jgi:hypothetical protein
MTLSSSYTLAAGRLPDLFEKIRDGQAPDQFTTQLLKDWGFTSSNDRAALPILKSLGFLSSDGKPTKRYHDYRDHSRSKIVMADALREAYPDLFLIKAMPTSADKEAIRGKFKSYHNASDNVANLMTSTFYSLLGLADLKANKPQDDKIEESKGPASDEGSSDFQEAKIENKKWGGLHYNIEVHLPATKDIEVYNAIFKSLREHFG